MASFTFPEIHGHRGCRGLYPENTLPAFRHALLLGVDVVELDVVLSADKQVVVSHEPWMSATICRTPAGERISVEQQLQHNLFQLPYAEIRRYDCGLTPHPGFPEQYLTPAFKPLLREVVRELDALAHSLQQPLVRFSIEVKSTPAGDGRFHPAPAEFLRTVVQELHQVHILSRTTLLCFDVRILQEARALVPELPLCLLVEDERPLQFHLTQLGFQPHVYGPNYHLVTPTLATDVRQLGIGLVPWTINELPNLRSMIDFQLTGITTDYPDRLLTLRNELSTAHT